MASPTGRGAQVRLDGDARKAARGALASSVEANRDAKRALELAGVVADGTTLDGSTWAGAAAEDEVLGSAGRQIAAAAGHGARFARLGDSLTANGKSGVVASTSADWLVWADLKMGGAIIANPADNFAVVGKTSAEVLNEQLPSVLAIANRIDFCTELSGTNDIGRDDLSADLVIANRKAVQDALLAANIRPVSVTILPRSDIAASPTKLKRIAQVNNWLRARAVAEPRIILIDAYPALSNGAGGYVTSYTYDNLHLNPVGAQAFGEGPVYNALSRVLRASSPLWYDTNDVYDATYNPTGNLITNGQMSGTGGSVAGLVSGAGGVASSWAWATSGGTLSSGTITASKVARADSFGSNQRLVLASALGTGTAQLIFEQVVTTSALVGGDVVEGSFDLAVAAGSAGIQSVALSMREYNPGGSLFYSTLAAIANVRLGTTGFAGPVRSPRWTVRGGTTAVSLRCIVTAEMATAGGCNLQVDLGVACVRRIV